MLAGQVRMLGLFYLNPRKAASAALDGGRFWFAALAAFAVSLVITIYAGQVEALEFRAMRGAIVVQEPPTPEQVEALMSRAEAIRSRPFSSGVMGLIGMGGLFVPIAIVFLAVAAHLGSVTTVLFRDYMPALSCLLFAWAAAHAPVAVLWISGIVPVQPGAPAIAASQWLGMGLFLAFAIPVLSTVTSASLPQCAMGAVVSGVLSIVASKLLSASNLHYMLLSPWLLFMVYQRFAGDMGMLGGGLSARQNFKRQLELATINPHDADAHYQLGLIYLQRHALTEALASFRRSVEIDPNDPDALFQLGRLLRQQPETAAEARQLLERAAHINPKLSNYEIWRELGGAALAMADVSEALAHLEPYTKAREFDPEGMVLYGQALAAAGRLPEARAAFAKAIEAARTAPDFRRHELRRWEAAAKRELSGLDA